MKIVNDYLRGLRASIARPSLVALGWAWVACLAVAAALATLVYSFVAGTVENSAMAEALREGQSASWIIDVVGQPGMGRAFGLLTLAALVLAPFYLVAAVFLSGGVVDGVERSLGMAPRREPESFFGACARHVGPMARLALVEAVILGIVVTALLTVRFGGGAAGLGNAFAWGWVAASLAILALVTALFDFARIQIVARDGRRAVGAWLDAMRFAGRHLPAVLAVVLVNLALALAVAGALVWLHSTVDLSTGPGLLLGAAVGQLSVLGRLWARIAAYATEAAVWQRADAAPPEPVRAVEPPFAVEEEPARAAESQPLG